MRKTIAALVAALFLSACVPIVASVAPGSSVLSSPYAWTKQGPPTGELKTVLDALVTPEDISEHLLKNYPWQDDYDTMRFLSPAELVAQKRGVCSAFARFWTFALAKQRTRAEFVAVWGPQSAHAYAIFRGDDGQWRLVSNQYLYRAPLGYERDQALAAGNVEFYGNSWSEAQLFDPDSGQVRQVFTNPNAPKTLLPLAVETPAGKNLFTVKR